MGLDTPEMEDEAGRQKMIKYLIFIPIIMLLFLEGCESKKIVAKEISQIPDQAIEKFTVTETQKGKKHWVVDAPSAKIYEDQKKALLATPVIKFYEKGKYVSTITAEKGTIDMGTYDIIGEGKCTVKTVKGEDLTTSNLRYLSQAQKIVTDDYVTLIKEGSVIHGKGMEATPGLETVTIKNQTTETAPEQQGI